MAAGLAAGAMVAATVTASAPALGSVTARGAARAAGPTIKLIATQHTITAGRGGGRVYFDPGIWVASLGAQLRIDVQRAKYSKRATVGEVVRTSSGQTRKRWLPGWTNANWTGLADFMKMTVRDNSGKVVARRKMTFCPDSYDPERTGPGSAKVSYFPEQCSWDGDPFPLANVLGIARGWAVDPAEQDYATVKLQLGTYHVTDTVLPEYRRFFHIKWRDATKSVVLHVTKNGGGCCSLSTRHSAPASGPLPSLPAVPLLRSVPKDALPDLSPLPSWGINTSTVKKTKQDYLNFGATVWVGGSSPLDVEGFRSGPSPIMHAYQYFWHDGRLVGRVRAGTMGYDNKKGHHHWHFQQFARYQLLKANKKVAVRSDKVGFCIAPTDATNMLIPNAEWNPTETGLGGECGSPTALWVQELMPIGWGDTYDQYKAGQAFNITSLPNGTYYIEIIANPEHVLHEVTRSNDISLRKVILSGTPGHRHVRVPAWHGIDPEHA